MRELILGAIEEIEIHMRTQMAYYHSHKYGADGYLLSSSYNARHDHESFKKHISSCIKENQKTLVVQHHMKKYAGKFPLWVIIEFFSIGMLSHFYRGMKTSDKKAIAKRLYGTLLESWTRCITDLRNKCAHYSRLYYTIFPATPKMPKWEENFVKPLIKLTQKYKPYINLKHLDFPYCWKSLLIK